MRVTLPCGGRKSFTLGSLGEGDVLPVTRLDRLPRLVARLSGGQRQAVAIARAIYWQAKVVLLDEPTAALAVMERERVIDHARDLAAHGVGVI